MWFLTLLPDALMVWIVHIITLAGILALVASFFLTKIPFVSQYGRILKIAGAIALVLGIYFEGGVATEQKWRDRVAELEAKVAESEKKSVAVNEKIRTKIVNQVKVVREKEIVIQEKIKEVEKVIDAKCEVPKEAIDILNEAAKNPGETTK